MHLQADETFWGHGIADVGALRAVQKCRHGTAGGFHAKLVPVARFKNLESLTAERIGITAELPRKKPEAPGFIVDAGGPHPFARNIGINFDLVTMDAAGGDFDRLPLPFNLGRVIETLA